MSLSEMRMEAFLQELASERLAPGGGSGAALAAAGGASLLGMVCRTMLRRRAGDSRLEEALREADRLRESGSKLMDQDAAAYTRVVEARRRVRHAGGTPALGLALREATVTPLEVVRTSCRVVELAATVAPDCHPNATGDLGVAALLAHASARAGSVTARANLCHLEDEAFVRAVTGELQDLERRTETGLQCVLAVAEDHAFPSVQDDREQPE